MLGIVKFTLFLFLDPWNFWKLILRTCTPLCYAWQIILDQEKSNQALLTMFLNSKVLVKLHRILFLLSMNLVGILLITDNNNNSFRNKVTNKFTPKVPKTKILSNSCLSKDKAAEIIKLSPLISACLSKKILKKSKFFDKEKELMTTNKAPQKWSYVQVAGPSVSEISKLRENYPNLLTKKIKNIIIVSMGKE